jgi:hypothetical protein
MAEESYTIEMGEQDYRLVGPEGEGTLAEYGTPSVLWGEPEGPDKAPALYYCLITDPDDQNPVVWCVDQVSHAPSEVEEVDFPKAVVAAQRALIAAIEANDTTTTVDVTAEQTE